ncbi:MAG: polysaccharide deacetylase family protein [Oscillospiraceae bacterium]
MVIRLKKVLSIFLGMVLIILGIIFFFYGIKIPLSSDNSSASTVMSNKIDASKPMVAITYDDGPYGPVTERILNSLKSVNGRATFFVVGSRIKGRETTIKMIDDYGSEIGNHTFSHILLTKLTRDGIALEINKSEELIFQITGKHTKLIRPPCGCYNSYTKEVVNKPMVLWTIDTMDWSHQNKGQTYKRVIENVKDGDIILMHDLFTPTAEASEMIIPELAKMGFQLVTVSELIEYKKDIKGIILNS